MKVEVKRIIEARQADFYSVHCESHGADWCYCVAWWLPTWDKFNDRSAEENRKLRDDLFEAGEYDGYLLYVDDAALGWCQVGPRDRLEKLIHQYRLEPDPAAWAISCFLIAPSLRGQGLSHQFLNGVTDDLRERGAGYLQAFPKRVAEFDAGEVWRGPEAIYTRAGFTLERDDARSPIYRKTLTAEPAT
jgi:GNAT superfamily N-acetyltransferase